MLGKLLEPELRELIHRGDLRQLRTFLMEMEPPDLADLIDDLPLNEMAVIFRLLPRQLATEVFELLPLEMQENIVRGLAQSEVAQILNDMSPDDRTLLLEELPPAVTVQAMSLLSPEELKTAKTLLGYPEDSIGRRMTPDYVRIREGWTVTEALDHIRRYGRASETLDVLYVVDHRGVLTDELTLRKLVLSGPDQKVADLMDRQFVALKATEDQEAAVETFRKYDRVALPITDSVGHMIGILTVDDVLDVATEEATEDIHKLGGLQALDTPYLATDLPEMIRKRAPWLVALLFGEMATILALARYEERIEQAAILAILMPLIISSGGNSGSQAASLVIRALALGEVTLASWWQVIRRELITGISLGLIVGAFGFIPAALYSQTGVYAPYWFLIGATITLTLIGVVLWGTLMGSILPILLRRIGFDPATASAPAVATLVDVTGLLIYFLIAITLLKGTILT